MANVALAWTPLSLPNVLNKGQMAFPLNYPTGDRGLQNDRPAQTYKSISGHVYDTNHSPKVGVVVLLFRQADNYFIAQTVTSAQGIYSFLRRNDDTNTYFTIAYITVGTQVHGVSDRGLVPA